MFRFLTRVTAITALILSLTLAGGQPASAVPGCDPSIDPTADLSVSQDVSASPDSQGSFTTATYVIAFTNNGPCSVAGFSFTDTLPAGYASAAITNVNPGSLACSGSTFATPTASFSCSYNGNLGVLPPTAGSSATVTLVVTWASTPHDTANLVQISSSAPTDPNSLNNSGYAGVAAGNAVVNANLGPTKKGDLPPAGQQGSQIAATAPGQTIRASLSFIPSNPDGSCALASGETSQKNCFGQLVRASAQQNNGHMGFNFVYAFSGLPAAVQALKITDTTILHRNPATNVLEALPDCAKDGTVPTRGCVLSRKVIQGMTDTFWVYEVLTDVNDDWGGGY